MIFIKSIFENSTNLSRFLSPSFLNKLLDHSKILINSSLVCFISGVTSSMLEPVFKKRNNTKILRNFVEQAPSSIIAYILSIDNQEKQMGKLITIFNKEIHEFIIPNLT